MAIMSSKVMGRFASAEGACAWPKPQAATASNKKTDKCFSMELSIRVERIRLSARRRSLHPGKSSEATADPSTPLRMTSKEGTRMKAKTRGREIPALRLLRFDESRAEN